MKKRIELLAPGGDLDSIIAAIIAGADAVYCGLDRFNARNSAANLSFENLQGILLFAHENDCQVFITLNIIILESEIPALIDLLNKLVNTSIDGVIIQDLGLFYLLSHYFKSLKIHASTQLTTHNEGQIKFLRQLNALRVNLSRELNINEIKALTSVAHENEIQTEVFVHGSNCISFSGICYMSSVLGGNSGNRGRCSQPCRDKYMTTLAGKNYPLNLKDNSVYLDLKELAEADVDSFKIEGRIKKFDYVHAVVKTWRKQLDDFYAQNELNSDRSDLYKVFNRDFSNNYLKGDLHKDMFIDNPRDHSIEHLSKQIHYSTKDELEEAQLKFYTEKEQHKLRVANEINQINITRIPLQICVSGECGGSLKINISTPDSSFVVTSKIYLSDKGTQALNHAMLFKRLKAINDTEYYIERLDVEKLSRNVYIPFKELTALKKKILFILNGSKELIDPIELPQLKKHKEEKRKASLSVLISSREDLYLCDETSATIYFQLPNGFKHDCSALIDLFLKNKELIPWFPSVLIAEDYTAVVEFLREVQPNLLVTDNAGIAYEAFKRGMPWIAGPYMNVINSYSLLALKELNCSGSFVSNEISKLQMQRMIKPEDFKLFYSIYHPIVLMTSRQCLFHQVVGCTKDRIDEDCLPSCHKSSQITNLKKNDFIIEKAKMSYTRIYNETNFLNADIVSDFPDLFSGFFIDLSDVKTKTKINLDKAKTIRLFQDLVNGNLESKKGLDEFIHGSTMHQYKKGI